jgi:hypothetical protein
VKRFLTALVLACVFSASVLAGDVPSDGFAPPPPGGTQTTTATSGEIPSGGFASSFIQIVIDLLT